MIPYEYHPDAASEFDEAAQFYDAHAFGLGSDFADEVDRALGEIRRHPEACVRLAGDSRCKTLRRFPYSLIYTFRPGLIYILAVAHQSRRPGYWRSRL